MCRTHLRLVTMNLYWICSLFARFFEHCFIYTKLPNYNSQKRQTFRFMQRCAFARFRREDRNTVDTFLRALLNEWLECQTMNSRWIRDKGLGRKYAINGPTRTEILVNLLTTLFLVLRAIVVWINGLMRPMGRDTGNSWKSKLEGSMWASESSRMFELLNSKKMPF